MNHLVIFINTQNACQIKTIGAMQLLFSESGTVAGRLISFAATSQINPADYRHGQNITRAIPLPNNEMWGYLAK
jgi:hypothetical protein